MSQMIELNLNPEERVLRQFGWIALGGFGLLAGLAFTESLLFSFGLGASRLPVALTLLGLGVVAAILGRVAPKANRPLFVGLSLLAYPIGFVMSYVVLGFLYFCMFAPLAIVFRVLGRDSMHRKLDEKAESYWSPSRPERPRTDYFRQF